MDTWSKADLARMVQGGNNKARAYYRDHGWRDFNGFHADKYTGRIGTSYKAQLERDVVNATTMDIANGKGGNGDGHCNAAGNENDGTRFVAPVPDIRPPLETPSSRLAAAQAEADAIKQPAAIIVQAPLAADASITGAGAPRRAPRRTAGLGARRRGGAAAPRKPAAPSSIDWSKVGSDVAPGPVVPKLAQKQRASSNPAISTSFGDGSAVSNGSASLSQEQFAERFRGKKAISSEDFNQPNFQDSNQAADLATRFAAATSLSSADYFPTQSASRRAGASRDNLTGVADGFIKAATEGVAQAADEVTSAFTDFLNKGYA